MYRVLCALAFGCLALSSVSADITNFTDWTLNEDPPNANFSAQVNPDSVATLTVTGAPNISTVDIGYQSVDGNTVDLSNQGYYFDPSADFALGIDFSLGLSNSPNGGFSIGFGIGEDGLGANSVGAVVASQSLGITVSALAAAGRTNDVTFSQLFSATNLFSGSFLISYQESSGNISVGIGAAGSNIATEEITFSGLQNDWGLIGGDQGLIVSFFARGGNDGLGTNFSSGTATGVFSNLRVISGDPTAVPEPALFAPLIALAAIAGVWFRRRKATVTG